MKSGSNLHADAISALRADREPSVRDVACPPLPRRLWAISCPGIRPGLNMRRTYAARTCRQTRRDVRARHHDIHPGICLGERKATEIKERITVPSLPHARSLCTRAASPGPPRTQADTRAHAMCMCICKTPREPIQRIGGKIPRLPCSPPRDPAPDSRVPHPETKPATSAVPRRASPGQRAHARATRAPATRPVAPAV